MPTTQITQLPLRHLSIRVPWHDSGWAGSVCANPAANTSCLVLKSIGGVRNDAQETVDRGRSLDVLTEERFPCCSGERGHFMAPFEFTRTKCHPYAENGSQSHAHFLPTPLRHPAYSADAIPFRWLRKPERWINAKATERDFREHYLVTLNEALEPELDFATGWMQQRDNHAAVLDRFFGYVRPSESLCFFYAKRTPLSEDSRRVIVGVGKVAHVGPNCEYKYSVPERDAPLRSLLWERMVQHTIRPKPGDAAGFDGGFLLPYREALLRAAEDASFDPASVVAFAPEERRDEFSYVTEHVTHDGAIGALLACAAALSEAEKHLSGPFAAYQKWIDTELGRLWKARGPFPGLGAALTAFGIELGTFVAHELVAGLGENEDPWPKVDAALANPKKHLSAEAARQIGPEHQKLWKGLKPQRRALLKLLARFEVTPDQAQLLYDPAARAEVGLSATDAELLANPYRFYELCRRTATPVGFATIDRGAFPESAVRDKHPLPEPSLVQTGTDPRRVRALVVEQLEAAAANGDTLVPRDSIIRDLSALPVRPGCPMNTDMMGVAEEEFAPEVCAVPLADGAGAFQLARLADTGKLIRETVNKRLTGKPHTVAADWRALLDATLPAAKAGDAEEVRARVEKVAALNALAAARFSVLIGPAGTGKTTVLAVLCGQQAVAAGGVLLLAPTGKARVRMEQAAQKHSLKLDGQTVAQFLLKSDRYVPETGTYCILGTSKKESVPDTVVIDEASMMTEEMLAAVLEAVSAAKRIILVGDHRQLPPIGAGRPFADIVRRLREPGASGLAELTVSRRQVGGAEDVRLAAWFAGTDPGPGEDDLFARLAEFGPNDRLQVHSWKTADECHELLLGVLQAELKLSGPDDVVGFGASLGGTVTDKGCYFNRTWERGGVGDGAERWQILSPVRGMPFGVVGLNRFVHQRFRAQAVEWARARYRKTPRPMGPEEIVYGDKVINVGNNRRYDVYPEEGAAKYVANGEIGIAVGQFKGPKAAYKSLPWKLEVEFTSQPCRTYGYSDRDFGDEGEPALELAYALTVHRAQGSEFGTVIVVVPNPCRLLSRELLYTALTRQQKRVVILFQGNPVELRRYADERFSETARRLTNLFGAPNPVEIEGRLYDERLIHRTARGEWVRSKSEVILANELHRLGVDYVYEKELKFGSDPARYPDFTIEDAATGRTVYWEHCGMLSDPDYAARWELKRAWYRKNGVLPLGEGEGANGTLVVTSDGASGFDSQDIERQSRAAGLIS